MFIHDHLSCLTEGTRRQHVNLRRTARCKILAIETHSALEYIPSLHLRPLLNQDNQLKPFAYPTKFIYHACMRQQQQRNTVSIERFLLLCASVCVCVCKRSVRAAALDSGGSMLSCIALLSRALSAVHLPSTARIQLRRVGKGTENKRRALSTRTTCFRGFDRGCCTRALKHMRGSACWVLQAQPHAATQSQRTSLDLSCPQKEIPFMNAYWLGQAPPPLEDMMSATMRP